MLYQSEKAMKMFLNDSEFCCDNNATEEAVCSFFLYEDMGKLIDSIYGAKSDVIISRIMETVKVNNLNLLHYLANVLTVLKDYQDDTDYNFRDETALLFRSVTRNLYSSVCL